MKMDPQKTIVFVALCSLFAVSPLFAQEAMPGMDMSTPPPPAPKTVKPHAGPAKPAKPKQNEGSMAGMGMSSMPGMDETPARSMSTHGATQSDAPKPGDAMQSVDMSGDKPQAAMSGVDNASMPGMDMSSMHGMDHPKQPQPVTTSELQRLDVGQRIGVRPVVRGLGLSSMSGDPMQGMPPMQGGSAPPNARSPDYSEGVGYGDMTGMDMHDDAAQTMLLIDQLEVTHGRDANGVGLDAQAWYGNDLDKLWLKVDGDYSGGRLQEMRSEALWDHAFATYWSTQLGARHDFGLGPGRNWAAFGVQGLAPYWFDIEATAYVGPSGRTAVRFEAEYELMLTQRLIFQPDLEANLYGRDDTRRSIGSGLSYVSLGLRLRYEFHRQFAPYVGINLVRKFGRTADFARAAGEHAFDPQLVAGVRIWF